MRTDPPDPHTAAGPAEFVARLRELQLWAGGPSLRRLHQLAGTVVDAGRGEIDALPVSTMSHVLRGDRLPRTEFVRAFVTACYRARHRDEDAIAEAVDRWHKAWLALRRAAPRADPPPAAAVAATTPVPRQLPPDVAGFTGRSAELAALEKILAAGDEPGSLVISMISGAGGIGKSALAIHAAHRLADRFPDGQLYVDLHGATAGLAPLEPVDVLGRFLRSLGMDGGEIPDQVDEAAAAFRTRVADRRLLLVLDNAADDSQVRPLLPGTPGCRVLVTGRPTLSTLDGAGHVHLEVLPEPDAVGLLSRVIGTARVAAEPAAVAEVARRCGYLPLALRIAGGRLAARPDWPVTGLANRLADEQRRLDELRITDGGVRASFDVSHRALRDSTDPADRAAARAFGLLGVWDGPDLPLPVAARLLDQPPPETERLLERLVDARLLETRPPGRYRLHDLLRVYSRERAEQAHAEADRVTALQRVLRFYAASSWRTLALLRPGDRRSARADPRWTTGGRDFVDSAEALAWLEAERPNLLAAADQAAGVDQLATAAVQLAQSLFGFFQVRRRWHDLAQVNRIALRVARDTADEVAEAQAHNDLGGAHHFRGQLDQALACHRHSLAIRQRLDDRDGQAASLDNLGNLYTALGQHDRAVAALGQSLAIRRASGDRHGEASSLNRLGVLNRLCGRDDEAVDALRRSLAIARELGDQEGQASCLNSLGAVYRGQCRHEQALACVQESLALNRALGNRYGVAADLDTIGTIQHAQGRYAEALDSYQQSLAGLREAGSRHDEAEVLRNAGDTLAALGRTDDAHAQWRAALAICEELRLPTGELRTRLTG